MTSKKFQVFLYQNVLFHSWIENYRTTKWNIFNTIL
ncbi:hypothetical protein Pint_14965 [Pistacia integerrima]|uniref:Uncharacterized protein n=1 Tax=Pistacia integerrima TaxID=434235 RepID=A0ACC0Z8M6_9ROSI|nr:hypothetical protein Pint_14965 [Pistacia integerrima]